MSQHFFSGADDDRQARLYKKSKGTEAKLSYLGHVLTENRNGLVVEARVTMASGTAEREAALEMLEERDQPEFLYHGE